MSNPYDDPGVYAYALRLATLAAPKPLAPRLSLPAPPPLKSTVFRPSHLFRESALRFPKELIPVLDAKLQRIAQGQDRDQYKSVLLRGTIGVFYNQFGHPDFKRKLQDERKIEELILKFVTIASRKLKERLGDIDTHAEELYDQVGTFVQIVKECLKAKEMGKVPSELFTRLDDYHRNMNPNALSLPRTDTFASSHSAASSSHHEHSVSLGAEPSARLNGIGATNVQDMPLVLAVGNLFGKSVQELQRDVVALRRLCTDAAAFQDLKTCINNVATGGAFPARPEDFPTDEAFQAWKRTESAELQELLIGMINRDPSLVSSARSEPLLTVAGGEHGNGGSNRSSMSGLGEKSADYNPTTDLTLLFYFVPPDPKRYYQRLFDIALAHDFEAMKDLPPEETVALTILSQQHEELLRECAKRWRIMSTFHVSIFLDSITLYFRDQAVPIDCVIGALKNLDEVVESWEYWRWPIVDRINLSQTLSGLFNDLLNRFFDVFQGLGDLDFADIVPVLDTVHQNVVFQEDIEGLDALLLDLAGGMKKFVGIAYADKEDECAYRWHEREVAEGRSGQGQGVEVFFGVLDWIKSKAKTFSREFPDPLVNAIDVPALFLEIAAPEFIQHLDRSRSILHAAASSAEEASRTDADLLELYRGVIDLQKMHNAFNPSYPLTIDLSSWFEPYVRRWLASTDAKTSEWARLAIAHDNFEAEGIEKHSSSIVDLIDSCKSATDFILQLKWPNEYENARYLTRLSKSIAKSIEQYSSQLEALFLAEMFPPRKDESTDQDVARPSAWMTKAKLAVQGGKKVEPFVFKAESCVKLNNIQAARKLLDTMYTTLDADKVATIVAEHGPAYPERTSAPLNFLFTVKMVLGENLVNPDGSSRAKLDPFLILSDTRGDRVAKTRTLYETNDPRWDETIDISVRGDLWVKATVYSRNLVDRHDIAGLGYLHLNPSDFGDFLTRDVWLTLEDEHENALEGRLLLRVSMEGEKDDIQFYFGKAFRSLKRAENDMTRTMVDKMSPFIRHYLSLATLHSLVKKSYNFDIDLERVRGDFNKVSGKLNAFVRDAISQNSSPVIPPVRNFDAPASPTIQTTVKRKGKGPLTDQEIEDAIGDLFDYFNVTFATLMQNLSTEAWDLVIARLWKDILSTIEALLVPPMSERPTEMKQLSEQEVDIVFKWLEFLVNFFHSEGDGVPLEDLKNAKYRGLKEARMFYDWSTDQLMEEAVRSMQRQLLTSAPSVLGRSKSVYQQRNLGTIRARKIQKKQANDTSGEMILRILRMRSGTADFLQQQMMTLARLQADQAQRQRLGSLQRHSNPSRGSGTRGRGGATSRRSAGRGLATIPDSY